MKTKAHISYKNKQGQSVPGVTTVLGVLAKPALIHWAWKLGIEGQDYRKYRDKMADIGTLAHYLIMCHLTGETPDLSEYSKADIDKAENCILSYFEWERSHKPEPIIIEKPLVSIKYQFGGTPDLVARINGTTCLVDFKTSKAVYEEMIYQLAAYSQLVSENGHKTQKAILLRIGRDEDEGFEEREIIDLSNEWEIFKCCLQLYNFRKGRT